MGCHTWFYEKVDDSSFPKEKIIEDLSREFDYWLNWADDVINGKDPDYTPNHGIKYKERLLKIKKRKFSKYKSYRELAVLIDKEFGYYEDHKYVVGKGWYKYYRYSEPFRVPNYPSTRLFSLEDMVKFIKNPFSRCQVYSYEDAIKFWELVPNGMIEFG